MYTPIGRRKGEKPRKSWEEGIREEIRERRLNEDQWNNRKKRRSWVKKRRKTL